MDMTDTRAPGADHSRYDCPIDFPMYGTWDRQVQFVGERATISWGYKDPFYVTNNTGFKLLGIRRLPYGVIYPGEIVTRQTDNFLACVGDDWYNAWPVQDAELDHGLSVNQITDSILTWQDIIESAIGKRPLMYSRKDWIDKFTRNDGWRQKEKWWIANYYSVDPWREYPHPPALPEGVTDYVIHQTTQKLPVPAGMMYRTYTDGDRWNGDAEAVKAFFAEAEPVVDWPARVVVLEAWAKEMAEIHNGFVKEQVQRNAYLQKTDTALATQYADANARLKVIEESIAEVENSLLEQTGVMEKLEARIAKLEAWKDTPL